MHTCIHDTVCALPSNHAFMTVLLPRHYLMWSHLVTRSCAIYMSITAQSQKWLIVKLYNVHIVFVAYKDWLHWSIVQIFHRSQHMSSKWSPACQYNSHIIVIPGNMMDSTNTSKHHMNNSLFCGNTTWTINIGLSSRCYTSSQPHNRL